ncbi:Fic family protein [Ferrimonas kyonanensis]|uniref:Fic family protein n=1 Tax=Ferrimonas kyonanensis TaxID=364763 RepID=UPI0004003712|nr:Fic family protein [Ferrimonas kyonanensis]
MYLTKIWPATHAEYQCFIPPGLSEQRIPFQQAPQAPMFAKAPLPVAFDYSRFLARYLGGGVCLKQGRTVSRRRLGLIAAGLATADPLAESVHEQAEAYLRGIELLQGQPFSQTLLCQLHHTLDPHHPRSGRIREVQNWIGGHSPDSANWVPPSPETLHRLVGDWCQYVREVSLWNIGQAIACTTQFICLHPFNDGNGRVNRVLCDHLFRLSMASEGRFVSPILYRLSQRHKGYFDTTTALEDGQWQGVFAFWQRALDWSVAISARFDDCVLSAHRQVQQQLAMRLPSADAATLIATLYQQPITTHQQLMRQQRWPIERADGTLKELLSYGLLTEHRLRHPKGQRVFECPMVLAAWMEMDALLFRCDGSQDRGNLT